MLSRDFNVAAYTFAGRFYGFTENSREVEMDTREMVDKVKKGEPLYGASKMSSYLQGVAARNSRYSELFIHVLPWINVVNHDQVSLYSGSLADHDIDCSTAWCRHGQVLPAG